MNRSLSFVGALTILSVTFLACGDDGSGSDSSPASNASSSSSMMTTNTATTGSATGGQGGAGNTATTGATTTAGGGGNDAPMVDLTFSGDCTPMFNSGISVATNTDSIAVYAQNGTPGDNTDDSSIQLALQDALGNQILSTQHRVDTGIVINLIDDNMTWTNISSDTPDPIGGEMNIVVNQQDDGIINVTFTNAVLVLPGNSSSSCVINGTLETFGEVFTQ